MVVKKSYLWQIRVGPFYRIGPKYSDVAGVGTHVRVLCARENLALLNILIQKHRSKERGKRKGGGRERKGSKKMCVCVCEREREGSKKVCVCVCVKERERERRE